MIVETNLERNGPSALWCRVVDDLLLQVLVDIAIPQPTPDAPGEIYVEVPIYERGNLRLFVWAEPGGHIEVKSLGYDGDDEHDTVFMHEEVPVGGYTVEEPWRQRVGGHNSLWIEIRPHLTEAHKAHIQAYGSIFRHGEPGFWDRLRGPR